MRFGALTMISHIPSAKGEKATLNQKASTVDADKFQSLLQEADMRLRTFLPIPGVAERTLPLPGTKQSRTGHETVEDALSSLQQLLLALQQMIIPFQTTQPTDGEQAKQVADVQTTDAIARIASELKIQMRELIASSVPDRLDLATASWTQLKKTLQNLENSMQASSLGNPQEDGMQSIRQIVQSIRDWMSYAERSENTIGNVLGNPLESAVMVSSENHVDPEANVSLIPNGNPNRVQEKGVLQPSNLPQTLMVLHARSEETKPSGSQQAFRSLKMNGSREHVQKETTPVTLLAVSEGQALTGNGTTQPREISIPASSFAEHLTQWLDGQGLANSGSWTKLGSGSYEFRIKLVPEGLGEIQVMIHTKDSNLSIQFAASSDQARQLLDAQSAQLRDLLSARGMHVDQVQVSSMTNTASFAFSQSDSQSRYGGNPSNKKQTTRIFRVDDLADGLHPANSIVHLQRYEDSTHSVIDTTA